MIKLGVRDIPASQFGPGQTAPLDCLHPAGVVQWFRHLDNHRCPSLQVAQCHGPVAYVDALQCVSVLLLSLFTFIHFATCVFYYLS